MDTSFYSVGIFNKIVIFIIWIYFFGAYHNKDKDHIRKKSFYLALCFFGITYLLDMEYYNKSILYDISLVYIFVFMKYVDQKATVRCFVSFGSVLLVCSMLEYVLYNFLGLGITLGTFDRGESEVEMQPVIQGIFNYYLVTDYSFYRFQSLFREPGYLGQCAGLILLFWGKIPLRYSIIWLVAGLMTVSLFFYVFLFLAIPMMFYIQIGGNVKLKLKWNYIFLLILVLAIFVYIAPDGVKDTIADRLAMYEADGKDNRSTVAFNIALFDLFQGPRCLWGAGATSFYKLGYAWGNTGIKEDIYKFGIIGIVVVLSAFYLLIKSYYLKSKAVFMVFMTFVLFYYNADIKYALHIYIPLIGLLNYLNDFKKI